MPDFFSRLIGRNLGLTEVVQPILPSRFATAEIDQPRISTASLREEHEEFERESSGPAETDAKPDAPFSGPTLLPRDKSPLLSPLIETAASQESRAVSKGMAVPDSEKVVITEKEATLPSPKKRDVSRERPLFVQPGATSSPESSSPREWLGSLPSKTVIKDEPYASRLERPPMQKEESDSVAIRPVPIRARVARPDIPINPPANESGSAFFYEHNANSLTESPTIKVHIGRVEVRAIMPPSPPPKKEPGLRRPNLTLEEYMNKRDRGRL